MSIELRGFRQTTFRIEGKKKKRKTLQCTYRESNPGQMLGRHLCYHYTTGA